MEFHDILNFQGMRQQILTLHRQPFATAWDGQLPKPQATKATLEDGSLSLGLGQIGIDRHRQS